MQQIVTLAERKAAEAARRQAVVEALVPALAAYARAWRPVPAVRLRRAGDDEA